MVKTSYAFKVHEHQVHVHTCMLQCDKEAFRVLLVKILLSYKPCLLSGLLCLQGYFHILGQNISFPPLPWLFLFAINYTPHTCTKKAVTMSHWVYSCQLLGFQTIQHTSCWPQAQTWVHCNSYLQPLFLVQYSNFLQITTLTPSDHS